MQILKQEAKMPIHPGILDDLAAAGANISIDAATTPEPRLAAIFQLWTHHSGTLSIRNADAIPGPILVQIARGLGSRVTFTE
jgi:hypothetical protein